MPWHIVSEHASCPASKPWAVVKDSDGSVAGCHPTKAKAEKQMAALYANVVSLPEAEDSEEMDDRAVDNSAWDGNKAMGACSSAADFASIAFERTVGEPGQRQHYALPHHYLGMGPNAEGTRNALARLPQTQNLKDAAAARKHLQAHMKQINPNYQASTEEPSEDIVRAMPVPFEVRVADEGKMPIMFGHPAVFDQWTEISSFWEGNFLERIAAGAFTKTIRENKGVKVLFQHGRDPQVGDKPLGPPEVLAEDETGLYAEVPLLDTSYNRDLIPGIEAGQYGQSFRFRVTREEIDEEPEVSDHNPKGLPERTIKEVHLMEFGPVTFPAYEGTDVGLRSLTDEVVYNLSAEMAESLRAQLYEPETSSEPDAGAETTSAGGDAGAADEAATTSPDADAGSVTTSVEEHRPERAIDEAHTEAKTMDANKTLTELEARQTEIRERQEELDADAGSAPLGADAQSEWDKLSAEYDENDRAIKAKRARLARLEKTRVDDPGTESGFEPPTNVSIIRDRGDEIYDLSTIRAAFSNPEAAKQELRDRAMKAIERARYPSLGKRASKEDMQTRAAEVLDNVVEDENSVLARRILATGHPLYEGAFWKKLQERQLSSPEEKVFERAALLVATAGYAVPFALDPTVALISDGVQNPLRAVSTVVSIAGDTWKGVNSAGITASFDTEQEEVSQDTPTLTQPSVTTLKAAAFVDFSIEAEIWDGLRAELTREIQAAKDELEGAKFTLGTGAPVPTGLMVGATYLATTAGSATIALADIDNLADALPPRYQANAVIMAHRKFYSKVRQLSRTAGMTDEWPNLSSADPRQLLDYPKYVNSNIDSGITTSGKLVAAVGDFRQFLIVDTVGLNVEYIPHMFALANNRPSGTRGIYAYWRTTCLVRAVNAFRLLKVL